MFHFLIALGLFLVNKGKSFAKYLPFKTLLSLSSAENTSSLQGKEEVSFLSFKNFFSQNKPKNIKSSGQKAAKKSKKSSCLQVPVASESWLQKAWRPLFMLSTGVILLNAYVIAPYLEAFFHISVMCPLPSAFFNLLDIGVGSYMIGRTVEKGIRSWPSLSYSTFLAEDERNTPYSKKTVSLKKDS